MSDPTEPSDDSIPAPAWQGPEQEEVFAVTFGDGGTFGIGARPMDSLQLVGKGELRIGPTGVVVIGKGRRPFSSKVERHEFAGADIMNVLCGGKVVTFRIPNKDDKIRTVHLEAADEAAAERMVALLPTVRSAKFAAELAALSEFHGRLDSVSSEPLVTRVLVVLNLIVFVAMVIGGAGFFEPDGEVAVRWGSNYGPLTVAGQWWRLTTSNFIHFGVIHLALNMLALYQTGGTTERLFGRGRFLALYLFAGLTGSLASLIWNPNVNSAGASGAIFGVFGGLLAFVLNPRNRVPAMVMAEHRNSTLLFAGYSLLYGAAHAGIDNAAHVGGLVGGFLMGLLLARPVDAAARKDSGTGRLLLSALAAVAVVGLMLAPILHPDESVRQQREYNTFLATFQTRENAAIGLMNQASEQLGEGNSVEDYSKKMQEAETVWSGLLHEVEKFKLAPGSPEADQQSALVSYFEARARLCHAASEAALGDPAANAAAEQAGKDAEAALQRLK